MHVLIWSPPWPVHGDPRFFLNAFSKHLCLQANILVDYADKVSVAAPAHLAQAAQVLDQRVNLVLFPLALSRVQMQQPDLLYQTLYTDPDGPVAREMERKLAPYLPQQVDVILLWENPAPFLRAIYPEALIINQMPGTFSRPPYPHMVTFDPVGLYRHGLLRNQADAIQAGVHLQSCDLTRADDFINGTRMAMGCFRSVADKVLDRAGRFQMTALLPLQASKHYAFAADSGFANQLDMLWSVLDGLPRDTGLIVTQYRNGVTSDMPLDSAVAASFAAEFDNFIYDQTLDGVDNASQYLLPHVDQVISASSSLGLQGMVWHKQLTALGDTFLAPYAHDRNLHPSGAWSDRCRSTIATILARHQPLASAVTQDGAFLFNLLTEMQHRQRKGAKGLDLLPDFAGIAPDYPTRLMQGLRVEKAAKSLSVRLAKDPASDQLLKLRGLIDDPATKAVSFDVFDTLICRSVEKPVDLFRFLEPQALALTNGIAADFGRVRSLCETETRHRLREVQAEITLDDIYQTVALYYGVAADSFEALKQAEIACEIGHARQRPFGRKMYDLAVASGKPVIFISDMYLSTDTVAQMLDRAGYAGRAAQLFVSSAHGCTKSAGDLFEIVLRDRHLSAAALVHVGDNKHSDIAMAEQRGIRAFRWSAAIEWQRTNPAFKDIYAPRIGSGEKARSAIAGTSARGLFDAPQPPENLRSIGGGDPYRTGFAVLGPLLTGYMMWLHREALRDGISDLYFMAREGWVLKEVYDQLFPAVAGGLRTHYLLGSRRAIRMAACRSPADVMALLAMPYDPGVPLSALIAGRFGITLTPADLPRLAGVNVPDITLALDRSFAHRQVLCAVVQVLMADILAQAAQERASYLAYLEQVGYLAAGQSAVIDVGWKANIQGALGDLTGQRGTGYYYATVQDSEIWLGLGDRHRAYAGTGLSPANARSPALHHRHMVEFMLCHGARSLVAMKQADKALVPVYRAEPALNQRRRIIDPLHAGAIAYARMFHDGFTGMFDQIHIPPDLAEAALTALLTRPVADDAQMFLGQSFEDALGGIAQKYIIAPDAKNAPQQSVWRAGAAVAHQSPKAAVARQKITAPPVCDPGTVTGYARLEALAVNHFGAPKKVGKYQRDRVAFFEDSQSPLVRLYWKTIAGRVH